jgi:hypothetical protein
MQRKPDGETCPAFPHLEAAPFSHKAGTAAPRDSDSHRCGRPAEKTLKKPLKKLGVAGWMFNFATNAIHS